jgi:hypothetical protein
MGAAESDVPMPSSSERSLDAVAVGAEAALFRALFAGEPCAVSTGLSPEPPPPQAESIVTNKQNRHAVNARCSASLMGGPLIMSNALSIFFFALCCWLFFAQLQPTMSRARRHCKDGLVARS